MDFELIKQSKFNDDDYNDNNDNNNNNQNNNSNDNNNNDDYNDYDNNKNNKNNNNDDDDDDDDDIIIIIIMIIIIMIIIIINGLPMANNFINLWVDWPFENKFFIYCYAQKHIYFKTVVQRWMHTLTNAFLSNTPLILIFINIVFVYIYTCIERKRGRECESVFTTVGQQKVNSYLLLFSILILW